MYYVYVLQHLPEKEIYIGYTENLKRRLQEHNKGKNGFTSKQSGEWKIIYVEIYRSKSDAYRREQRLKYHGRAKQELLKRAKDSLFGD